MRLVTPHCSLRCPPSCDQPASTHGDPGRGLARARDTPCTKSPSTRDSFSLEVRGEGDKKLGQMRSSPDQRYVSTLRVAAEVGMGEHSVDMPLLLGPLLGPQVPLPGHNEEVVMVQLIVQLGAESGADHPPGGEDGPGTVVTTQT